jgi:hypothetical protein
LAIIFKANCFTPALLFSWNLFRPSGLNDLFTLHTKKMAWCWKGSSWKAIHILFLFQIAACVDDRIMDPLSPREIISLPKKSTKNTLFPLGDTDEPGGNSNDREGKTLVFQICRSCMAFCISHFSLETM